MFLRRPVWWEPFYNLDGVKSVQQGQGRRIKEKELEDGSRTKEIVEEEARSSSRMTRFTPLFCAISASYEYSGHTR